jgi:UDP-2,3-diacylglucosamine pyrophosphatase LpxH
MVTEPHNYQLIIVSDLHLSEGWNPKTKRLSRNEDFFFDLNFQRFLQHLAGRAERGRFSYKLLINGDFIDFLQFTSVPYDKTIGGEVITERERELGLGTSSIKTLWKLNILMNGHWLFFNALKEFVSRGNEVIIIPGNHDIEWVIPEVQTSFKERLSADIPNDKKAEFINRIQFVPWFYYDPYLSIFVEHGSQYDDLNSFDYYLYPYMQDGRVYLPAGSFFVRYLFNRVERYYPFADNMKPMSKFIWWAIWRRKTWFSCPPRIIKFIKFFLNTLTKAGPIDKEWQKELDIRQAKELQAKANKSGLSIEQIEEIKKLWVPSSLHNCSKWNLLKSFISNPKLDSRYYLNRAIAIQQILGVRYVVFGHTHDADIQSLSEIPGGKKSEYVNSGTWTKTFAANYEEALLKSENEFVYVNIKHNEAKKDVKMELLRWNDSIREGERVRLFEEE